jgi:hypothetical protein
MLVSLALLTFTTAAPAPKDPPPPVEVNARYTVHPVWVEVGRPPTPVHADDGHFIEVTIRNTSKETLSFNSRHDLSDLVYVKVTDEKGKEVSQVGYHLLYL